MYMENFNKTVKGILEEVKSKLPYRLLSPTYYSSVVVVQDKRHYVGFSVFGELFSIRENGTLRGWDIISLDKGKKFIKDIKENWQKGVIIGGGELRRYLGAEKKNVVDNDYVKYVIHDPSIIPNIDSTFTGRNVYLKPTEFGKAPEEVQDVFNDVFEEL